MNTPLEELGLNLRCFYALKRAGYNHIEEIANMSDKEFLRIKSLGVGCLAKIRECLNRRQGGGE